MKRIWVIIEKESGKIVFASTEQQEFIDHKFINSESYDRGNYGMEESTLEAIKKAYNGIGKNKKDVYLFDGEPDLTKSGVLLRLEGNSIVAATYAVESENEQITA